MKIIKEIEQFGDVHDGTCAGSGYKHFDHSQHEELYGFSISVDLYTKAAADASTLEDLIQV